MKKKTLILIILALLILSAVGIATYKNFIQPVTIKDSQDNNKFSFYLNITDMPSDPGPSFRREIVAINHIRNKTQKHNITSKQRKCRENKIK